MKTQGTWPERPPECVPVRIVHDGLALPYGHLRKDNQGRWGWKVGVAMYRAQPGDRWKLLMDADEWRERQKPEQGTIGVDHPSEPCECKVWNDNLYSVVGKWTGERWEYLNGEGMGSVWNGDRWERHYTTPVQDPAPDTTEPYEGPWVSPDRKPQHDGPLYFTRKDAPHMLVGVNYRCGADPWPGDILEWCPMLACHADMIPPKPKPEPLRCIDPGCDRTPLSFIGKDCSIACQCGITRYYDKGTDKDEAERHWRELAAKTRGEG